MTVDGIHSERWTTAGTFSMLSSSRLFVGGADPSHALPGLRTRNDFIGCLRKVQSLLVQSIRNPLALRADCAQQFHLARAE